MKLHHVLPLALDAGAVLARTDQRHREKFARRRLRHRRSIPIAVAVATAIAVSTVPLLAETDDGTTLVFDGGHVISQRDALTDEYDFTAIGIGTLDGVEGEVTVLHGTSGLYAVMFLPHSASSTRDADQVTWRIDRGPVQTFDGFWTDEHFCFLVDSDMFLDFLTGAERLRYRIGAGEVMEVLIPEALAAGVAFFRRQVALHAN